MSANRCLALLLLLISAGCCGSDGPARFTVTGNITHGDVPIPAGQIFFEPDESLGNTGPQGVAEIEDGQYRTLSDRGCVNGPMIATVRANTGEPHPENPRGLPLFPPFQLKLTIDDSARDFDIVVPADHSY